MQVWDDGPFLESYYFWAAAVAGHVFNIPVMFLILYICEVVAVVTEVDMAGCK